MMKFLIVLVAAFGAINAEKVVPMATGGFDANWGAFPSAVILDTPTQYCGATILNHRHILTAAACVVNDRFEIIHPRWFNVIAGDIFFSPPSMSRLNRNISQIYVHPEYNPFNGENNIAVLRIDPSFTFPQNTIQAAEINTRILQNGLVCQLAAWGRVNAPALTTRPRQVVVTQPILDRNDCAAAITPHANRISETMICATSTAAQAPCHGNLGSGLYCNGELTGVLTGGIACGAANTPAVYQQIRAYNFWINLQFSRTDNIFPGSSPFDTQGFPVPINRN